MFFGLYVGAVYQKRKIREIISKEERAKWGSPITLSDDETIDYEVNSVETKDGFSDQNALCIGAILKAPLEWNLFRYMSLTSSITASSNFEVMDRYLIIGVIPLIFSGYFGQLNWQF